MKGRSKRLLKSTAKNTRESKTEKTKTKRFSWEKALTYGNLFLSSAFHALFQAWGSFLRKQMDIGEYVTCPQPLRSVMTL